MKSRKPPRTALIPTRIEPSKETRVAPNVADVASAIANAKNDLTTQTSHRRRPRRLLNSDGRLVCRTPNVPLRRSTASPQLLHLVGHRHGCVVLTKAGQIASCDCHINPIEDPAVTVGLVIHSAKMCLRQRTPLPPVIVELLARRLAEGDPACRMVAEWLEGCGLIRMRAVARAGGDGSDRS
jgi:hypothetical protein